MDIPAGINYNHVRMTFPLVIVPKDTGLCVSRIKHIQQNGELSRKQ